MGLEVTSIQKGQLSQATEAVDQTLLLLKPENFKNHIGTVSFALPPEHSKVETLYPAHGVCVYVHVGVHEPVWRSWVALRCLPLHYSPF